MSVMSEASKNSNLICKWDYIPIYNPIHAINESKVAELKVKVLVFLPFTASFRSPFKPLTFTLLL